MHDVMKPCMCRRSIKVQAIPMGFNVTGSEKRIAMVSDSTLQLTFKKPPLVELWCSIKEEYGQLPEKAITYFSLYQLLICMRPDYLYMLQPKQQIETKNR